MTSVLDQMTADVTSVKQAASLTPVGTEKPRLPETTTTFMTQERIEGVIRQLRDSAATLTREADALDAALGKAPEERLQEGQELEVKLMEREADRKAADRAKADGGDKRAQERVDAITPEVEAAQSEAFAERMNRLQAEAAAATFGDAPEEALPEVRVTNVDGWVCPEHGEDALKDVRSSKGREYRACTICGKFQK